MTEIAQATPIVLTETRHLDNKLHALKEQAHIHLGTYRRTHEQLRELLAQTYLWWHEASETPEYLESLYRSRHIRFYEKGSNLPNFSPLIRLVWGMEDLTKTDRVTVSQWNKALQSMHQHYTDHLESFRHNAKGKLKAYMEANGGVDGLASTNDTVANDCNPPIRPPGGSIGDAPFQADVEEERSRLAITAMKSDAGIGSATVHHPVRVNSDGLFLLLARQETNGASTILGSSSDQALIKAVASDAMRRGIGNLPPSHRALIETIRTQAFPSQSLPSSPEKRCEWLSTKYADQSDFWERCIDCRPQGPRLKSDKRLLIRGEDNDILLSSNMIFASPVTRCIPTQPLFDTLHPLYLEGSERFQIEQWIGSGEISLFRAEPSDDCTLSLVNVASGSPTTLHFGDHLPELDISHHQGDFERDLFTPDWTTQLSVDWFMNLRVWADKWFGGLGKFNQITRPHNAVLTLNVSAHGLSIVYNQQDVTCAPSETIRFPQPMEMQSPQELTFLSKDIAPVLFNLADAPVTGDISVEGNAHVLY